MYLFNTMIVAYTIFSAAAHFIKLPDLVHYMVQFPFNFFSLLNHAPYVSHHNNDNSNNNKGNHI